MRLAIITFCVVASFGLSVCRGGPFVPIGDLPGGDFRSAAKNITPDGTVVVGWSKSSLGTDAFRWTESSGMEPLGDLAGGRYYSQPGGISADGTVVVGWSASALSPIGTEAFRWTEATGMEPLGDLPGGDFHSGGNAVSADGTLIVGEGRTTFDGTEGSVAAWWTEQDGWQRLAPQAELGTATDVSADGSVIVGKTASTDGAFRWTTGDGLVSLGGFPGGEEYQSYAAAVSDDGNVVVGHSWSPDFMQDQAALWTESTGIVGLGDLPGGTSHSSATNVSADGTVVVGFSYTATHQEATVWDEVNGLRSIEDILTLYAVDFSGWQLNYATDVSGDGSVVVGGGINPDGNDEGWLVDFNQLPPIPGPYGDANGDGHVDGADYLVWAFYFGQTDPPGTLLGAANGDFNEDSEVNGLDYLVWAGTFGQGPNDGVVVPEPASLVFLAIGVGVLIVQRRSCQSLVGHNNS